MADPVIVNGETSQVVTTAINTAVSTGAKGVFLPAGDYLFAATVMVPGGLTISGEPGATRIRGNDPNRWQFRTTGDRVRFTGLTLIGWNDADWSVVHNSRGIQVLGQQHVRIDNCELSGFNVAVQCSDQAAVQVDGCSIHHNLRESEGYGVMAVTGAYVLVMGCQFAQNRRSLATNGAISLNAEGTLWVHDPSIRKTHWEFIGNTIVGDDLTRYGQAAVDTHPGMDGSFLIEANQFSNLQRGIAIRDGTGVIRRNTFEALTGAIEPVNIFWHHHNGIPVEGTMPRHIRLHENRQDGALVLPILGTAEQVEAEGELLAPTATGNTMRQVMLRLVPMDASGTLGWGP